MQSDNRTDAASAGILSPRLRAAIAPLLCAVALGCGGSSASPPDAAPDAAPWDVAVDSDGAGGAVPDLAPQVQYGGGQVLTTPRFYLITFTGDPYADQLEQLAQQLGPSDYWHAITSEYGVGAGSSASIRLANEFASQITDADVRAYLEQQLSGTSPVFGAPDSQTIYTIFLPLEVSNTGVGGKANTGYHSHYTRANGMQIAYAVIPRHHLTAGPALSLDIVSATFSHEALEAATDPFPGGYGGLADPELAWTLGLPGGTELGDMCEYTARINVTGLVAPVVRGWSNQAAAAGHNPCVPVPAGEPYVYAVPTTPMDTFAVTWTERMQQHTTVTSGYTIAVGQSRTLDLVLASDMPIGAWSLAASQSNLEPGTEPSLMFALDKTTGQAGDRVELTITALAHDASGGVPFAVVSSIGQTHYTWYGLVGN